MFQDLYFVNVKKAIELISNRDLADSIVIKYLVVAAILMGALVEIPMEIQYEKSSGGFFEGFIGVLIFIAHAVISYRGVVDCKIINDEKGRHQFFNRFLVLSVPVGISLSIIYAIFLLSLVFILPAFNDLVGNEQTLLLLFSLFKLLFIVFFYQFMKSAFNKIECNS